MGPGTQTTGEGVLMARYRCHLCPGRPWVSVPAPVGASEARHEQLALAGFERHYAREHGGGR